MYQVVRYRSGRRDKVVSSPLSADDAIRMAESLIETLTFEPSISYRIEPIDA
jgi:hypothetical protein